MIKMRLLTIGLNHFIMIMFWSKILEDRKV